MSDSQGLSLRDKVYPSEIIGAASASPAIVDGVLQECPLCGAFADEAPEGVYGYHRPVPVNAKNPDGTKKYKYGDPIWEAQHCFKCGYRPGTNSAVFDEVKARQAFNKWYDEQTADSTNHPTQQGFSDAQLEQIQGLLRNSLSGLLNPQSSVSDGSSVQTEKG